MGDKRNIDFYKTQKALYNKLCFYPSYPLSDFHIFSFEDLLDTPNYLPPNRRGFFQLALVTDFGDTERSLDVSFYQPKSSSVHFVGPNRLLSWVHTKQMKCF